MTKQASEWQSFEGKNIPSSSNLFPIIFDFISKDSRILDIGCGYGKTVLELYKLGYSQVYGVDVNPNGIALAKEKAAELGLDLPDKRFKTADASSLPFAEQSFDCVITQAFWTSILSSERLSIFSDIKRILLPTGTLYLAQWAQTWRLPLYRERYLQGLEKGLEEGSFEVIDPQTKEVKYIAHHYSERELVELLLAGGFEIKAYTYETAKTQSGNLANCHVIIAKLIS